MKNMITLKASHLRLVNLGGLVSETLALATSKMDALGAVATLGLAPVFQSLFAANTVMLDFYNKRLNEMSAAKGPSASSLKNKLVVAYNDFCAAVILTLSTLPSRELQVLRNEMNAIRRKYIQRKFKDSKISEKLN
jgi:hypothetical protein